MQSFQKFQNYTAVFSGFYQPITAICHHLYYCYAINGRRGIPSTGTKIAHLLY